MAITRKTEWSDTYQNIGNEVVNMATHVDSSSQIGYDWADAAEFSNRTHTSCRKNIMHEKWESSRINGFDDDEK